jgi:putative spermidine/putrescine transport system substrate-binding protein
MKCNITRRDFLKVTGGGLAAASFGLGAPFINSAHAANKLSVVDWGPPYIDCAKTVAKKWGKASITWTLHAGGAAGVLAKLKTTWPNSPYDVIDAYEAVFISMIKEGWAEPVTLDDCPNLKDIPEVLITKDKKGNWMSIPRGMSPGFWVATENCPIKITTIEDLLDPKLKGQILWPNPTLNGNAQVMNFALVRGGDQYNMEPGWQFLKELAKSGNIGRVSANTSDIITSLETGETSVTYVDLGTTGGIKGTKVNYLNKIHESLKSNFFVTGWVVLSSSKNKKLAFDFANATISKEGSEIHYKMTGELPVHLKADLPAEANQFRYSGAELKKYAMEIDWDNVGKQLDGWNKYFEKEIVPLF